MRRLGLVALLALVMSACGSSEATGPPEINYGRDICTGCGMTVDDPRFAAAYRPAEGTEKVFDDVGGMVIYGRDHGELETSKIWVHDYETEEWVAADAAFFVPTQSVPTPMGHGILAFASQERAEAFAADLGGTIISWEEVTALPVDDGLLGEHHDHD